MFITQLLNRASTMMWAAIKKKQSKTKQKKKQKNITPAAMRHQHQMYMRFPHCTMYEMKKGQTFEGLCSERPKNKQDKVLKDKKVIDKMKKGQNKKSKTVPGQTAYRTMW